MEDNRKVNQNDIFFGIQVWNESVVSGEGDLIVVSVYSPEGRRKIVHAEVKSNKSVPDKLYDKVEQTLKTKK